MDSKVMSNQLTTNEEIIRAATDPGKTTNDKVEILEAINVSIPEQDKSKWKDVLDALIEDI